MFVQVASIVYLFGRLYVGLTSSVALYTFDPIELDYSSEPYCRPLYRATAPESSSSAAARQADSSSRLPTASLDHHEQRKAKKTATSLSSRSSHQRTRSTKDSKKVKFSHASRSHPAGFGANQGVAQRWDQWRNGTSAPQCHPWRTAHTPLTCASLLTGDGEITTPTVTLMSSSLLSAKPAHLGHTESEQTDLQSVSALPLWRSSQLTTQLGTMQPRSLTTTGGVKGMDSERLGNRPPMVGGMRLHAHPHRRTKSMEHVPGSHLPLLALNSSMHKTMKLRTFTAEHSGRVRMQSQSAIARIHNTPCN